MTHTDIAAGAPGRAGERPTTVLLRSGWQSVNIGDVAHAPGAARALQDQGAEVILWPLELGGRERAMLRRFLPDLEIVDGTLDDAGQPSTPALTEAWERADVFVHGPASRPLAAKGIRAWRQSGKPYGYLGVSADPMSPPAWGTLAELRDMIAALPHNYLAAEERDLLSGAEFIFCRDGVSLAYLRSQGVTPTALEFGPDATFAYTYGDDVAARAFLDQFGLEPGEFACFVPRLRYAPYHEIHGTEPTREQVRRSALNTATWRADWQVLADVIDEWARGTGLPAVVVPEMSYVPELAVERLPGMIPADIRDRVHILDRYWPLEEASAVYAMSSLVVSMECHSPILALAGGAPAIYLRQPTETVKGSMFADLGDSEMVVEIEPDAVSEIRTVVEHIVADPTGAAERARTVADSARTRLHEVAAAVVSGACT